MISAGGVSVLFTLVLIFMYLVYVIKPVFESASIEPETTIQFVEQGNTVAVGVDELKEIGFQISEQGVMSFYQLRANDQHPVGEQLLIEPLLIDDETLQKVRATTANQYILLTTKGTIKVVQPAFLLSFDGDKRMMKPAVRYPLGEDAIFIDENEAKIVDFSFVMNEEKAVILALTEDKRLIKTSLIAEDDFNYDPEFSAEYQLVQEDVEAIDFIQVTPDMTLGMVASNNEVSVYELDSDWDVPLKGQFNPVIEQKANITAMALLSGSSSILFGTDKGKVLQWFEVATADGREFQQIRSFGVSVDEPVTKIYPELYRKSFFTVTPAGEVGLFYTTSEADLWRGQMLESDQQLMAIAPRANGLAIAGNGELEVLTVHNEHPEVTWSALWQEVWYEGYPEPDYIWQSTSGSDDFEAKFSLVPISFGTMKAAMYAMLFAVPVAIAAAIYTAYFMPPVMRRTVKPTIELMEALPTVILGFLAGLWLAPLIEAYLPAVFLLLILLPLATFVTAFAWYKLPKNIKVMLPESFAPLIILPVLILAALLAFYLSPVVEASWFGGDMRKFITNDLGIDFDQRNALVVGIAMGFAVIPTIFSMAEDAIFSVPKHLTSGSLALGATQWQTLVKVVLLTASPGIFSAVMMGLGRAVGETMIVLMATGNTPVIDWSIFQGMRTLSANIAVEMPESEVGSSHYRILFLAAFVLFVFTFVFNTLAEFVRQRLREKYSSL
ncbi:ABC transporter permease subunit [Thalassotalea mangrovi]|uniref:ABC transporter permease subunit n=1 Tax=Thalassotalea mangrovi TaxID=2572245 RepID=A0A4U1B2R2_9GAMM|nr:ABC transporter permease subunit [Thalassotalea mangrovi]TKB43212.1 ABC transporter permease subunit [Thalassotalea mangrovi]